MLLRIINVYLPPVGITFHLQNAIIYFWWKKGRKEERKFQVSMIRKFSSDHSHVDACTQREVGWETVVELCLRRRVEDGVNWEFGSNFQMLNGEISYDWCWIVNFCLFSLLFVVFVSIKGSSWGQYLSVKI